MTFNANKKIIMCATICCPLTMSLYYCYKSYNNNTSTDKEIIETDYVMNWFHNECGKTIKHKHIQRY